MMINDNWSESRQNYKCIIHVLCIYITSARLRTCKLYRWEVVQVQLLQLYDNIIYEYDQHAILSNFKIFYSRLVCLYSFNYYFCFLNQCLPLSELWRGCTVGSSQCTDTIWRRRWQFIRDLTVNGYCIFFRDGVVTQQRLLAKHDSSKISRQYILYLL